MKKKRKNSERIIKIKPFIHKYNWEGINFAWQKDDWKKIEKNNVTIALKVLYPTTGKINPSHVSIHNSTSEKPVILLIIPNGGWHYLAVKKLSTLLRRTLLTTITVTFIAWIVIIPL